MILKHERIKSGNALHGLVDRDHIHLVAGRFRHLAETDDDMIAEVQFVGVIHVFNQDTDFLCFFLVLPQLGIAHFHGSFHNCFS